MEQNPNLGTAPGACKFCPNCGAPVLDAAAFCHRCGARLPLFSAPDRKTCIGCGSQNVLTSEYCYKCGLKLPQPVAGYQSPVQYGGFWERLGASLIDGLVLIVPIIIVSIPFFVKFFNWVEDYSRNYNGYYYYNYYGNFTGAFFAWYFLWVLAVYVVEIAYYTISVGVWDTTIGKRAVGLKIVRTDGSKVSYARAFGRSLAYMLNGFTYSLSFLVIVFNEKKRGIHDYMADTIVIKTK